MENGECSSPCALRVPRVLRGENFYSSLLNGTADSPDFTDSADFTAFTAFTNSTEIN